jgi:hypothetical protein
MDPITWFVIAVTLAMCATVMFLCCCAVGQRADEQSDALMRNLGIGEG